LMANTAGLSFFLRVAFRWVHGTRDQTCSFSANYPARHI
jgi:hypothetical protein